MKTIGEGAFAGNHLARIAVPEGVTEIGDDAFSGNTLSSITLPDSLISIGDRAFYTATANNSLTSLTIPANVTSIGSAAFQSYKELETITVEGSGAIAIGSAAFGDSKDNAYSKDGENPDPHEAGRHNGRGDARPRRHHPDPERGGGGKL